MKKCTIQGKPKSDIHDIFEPQLREKSFIVKVTKIQGGETGLLLVLEKTEEETLDKNTKKIITKTYQQEIQGKNDNLIITERERI